MRYGVGENCDVSGITASRAAAGSCCGRPRAVSKRRVVVDSETKFCKDDEELEADVMVT